MRHSRLAKPGSIANVQIEIQIVDTHESLKTVINNGFTASKTQFNRTLLTGTPDELLMGTSINRHREERSDVAIQKDR